MSDRPEKEESAAQAEGADPVGGPLQESGTDAGATAAPAEGSGRWSRRRFGKAALGTTPILATLYGRPLMASHNCSPSGWVSGNTSMRHEDRLCGGRTPGYWQSDNSKRQHDGWKQIHLLPLNDATYGFDFLVGDMAVIRDDGSMGTATLDDAVQGPGVEPFVGISDIDRQILRLGTAALNNARFLGATPDEELVRALVEGGLLGLYRTDSGDELDAEQVKDFLESTMDFDPD